MDRLIYILRKITIKSKNQNGFTLAETLVAILILLMVSAVVAAGIPAARNAYERVEKAANAELLMSTTISTLRNELGLAKDVKEETVKAKDSNNNEINCSAIEYLNPATGSKSQIYKLASGENDGVIMFNRYAETDMSAASGDATRLISNELTTKVNQDITYKSVALSDDKEYIVFTDLKVLSGGKVITSRPQVSIRIITY